MKPFSRKAQPARLLSRRWLTRAGAAFVVSACAHAVAAVTVGVVLHALPPSPTDAPEAVDIDLAPGPTFPSGLAGTIVANQQTEPAPESARLPAALARPALGPSSRSVTRPAAPVPSAPDEPNGSACFVLNAGAVTTGPSHSSPPAPSALPADIGGGDVASEAEVNVPARLLSSGPLVYPPAARQAEIEIDFPLEIVVGVDGLVMSARAIGHAGYGLDEAALRAIRAYRFSPALRAGHAVRVRMRWTVQFRLG